MTINPSILRLISAPILALSAVTSLGVTNGRTSILTQKSDVVLCPNVEELLITGEDAEARIAHLIWWMLFFWRWPRRAPESQKEIFAGRRSENNETFGSRIRLARTSDRPP
jgi:hypothetical protein